MKRRLCLGLVMVLCLLVGTVAAETFIGTGEGNNGDICVQVNVDNGVIIAVEVLSHSETQGICENALSTIPVKIVESNGIEVEIVAGATNTSKGILEATEDALTQAGMIESESDGWKTWPGMQVYEDKESLEAFRAESEERYIQAQLEYAPTVKTLENGVKVQAVPSDYLAWNVGVLKAEERGCEACHTIEDALYNLPSPHSVLLANYGESISINTCLACHKYVFENGYGYRTYIREAMHGLHLESDNFDGNCFSCHYMNSDGEYLLWDNAKYSAFTGLTNVSDVKGEFSFDQNVTVSADDVFTHVTEQGHPNGVTVIASNDKEAYEQWELKVGGAVDTPISIKLPEIEKYPLVDRILKNACIIGGLGDCMVANCNVRGIDLDDLMEIVGVHEDANYVLFKGKDNEENKWIAPMDMLTADESDNAMLVYAIDGEYLPSALGAPWALWWGNYNGNVYVRYIYEIEFIASEEPINSSMMGKCTNFETLKSALAGCRIDRYVENVEFCNLPNHTVLNAEEGQIFEAGESITFEGFADAYNETITTVEFSLDGGVTWDVHETKGATVDRWVYWYYTLSDLRPGSYVLTMRCTTNTGRMTNGVTNFLFHVQ